MASAIAVRAAWAGPGARRLAGCGEVEIALWPGGYARIGASWLLIAVADAPRGPLSVLVPGLDAAPLEVGTPVRVMAPCTSASGIHHSHRDDVMLCAGEHVVSLRGAGGATAIPAGPLRPGWRAALTAALEASPTPSATLADGLRALRRDDLASAVLALAGRGEGLTPAGDDVLAGYAAWRHAAGRPIALTAAGPPRDPAAPAHDLAALTGARCSPLGLAYLHCAQRGELAQPAIAVLRAVRAGDAEAARRRAKALSRWGSSSGAAILWGMAAAA